MQCADVDRGIVSGPNDEDRIETNVRGRRRDLLHRCKDLGLQRRVDVLPHVIDDARDFPVSLRIGKTDSPCARADLGNMEPDRAVANVFARKRSIDHDRGGTSRAYPRR